VELLHVVSSADATLTQLHNGSVSGQLIG